MQQVQYKGRCFFKKEGEVRGGMVCKQGVAAPVTKQPLVGQLYMHYIVSALHN
jgi:hypothetical protein